MKSFLRYHIKDRISLVLEKRLLLKNKEHTPILVLTMAKVGSSSVYYSIKKSSKIPVFHIHGLDEEEVLEGVKSCRENGIYPGRRSPIPLINREIIAKNRPYKIISLFRNPIERNISAFFDVFELRVGIPPDLYKGGIHELEKLYHKHIDHSYVLDWFDIHFFEGTGIDIYKEPFDIKEKSKKYTIDGLEILVLDSAVQDSIKERLIGEFSGIRDFKLTNKNITEQSRASDLYTKFKEHVRFSEAYLNSLLDSKYAVHFFSVEERETLFNKWSK